MPHAVLLSMDIDFFWVKPMDIDTFNDVYHVNFVSDRLFWTVSLLHEY